jgi:signal transduction histidine kinase
VSPNADGEGASTAGERGASLERQSHVRHELRAPLAVMYPLVSLLLDEGAGPLTTAQRGHLEMLERNVLKLHVLVGSALESGWPDCPAASPEASAVPLARTAADAVARLTAGEFKGARVPVEAQGPRAVAWADREHVRCIVRNLVDNALRYGDTGEARVCVRAGRGGAVVALEVEDAGPGMAPADAERAFEFGARGARALESGAPGLGAGLWVCRRLAALNGGSVDLATAEGRGTTVTVTLPRAPG